MFIAILGYAFYIICLIGLVGFVWILLKYTFGDIFEIISQPERK